MKGCLQYSIIAVLLAISIAASMFYLGGIDLAYRAFYEPAVVQIERNVTENSKGFIDSTNAAAAAQISEYYRVNTMRVASESNGDNAMAEAYRSQMESIEDFICSTIASLDAAYYSSTVSSFVASGACTAGR